MVFQRGVQPWSHPEVFPPTTFAWRLPWTGLLLGLAALLLALGLVSWLGAPLGEAALDRPQAAIARGITPGDVSYILGLYAGSSREDPLVTLEGDPQVKSSNYYGVRIGTTTYYYDARPHQSFDPLSRGAVSRQDIRVAHRVEDPSFPLVIYTIEGGRRRP